MGSKTEVFNLEGGTAVKVGRTVLVVAVLESGERQSRNRRAGVLYCSDA